MTGNKGPGTVIQERDLHLLRELGVMRVIDREQAKLVAGFHSTTRVNARLLRLTEAGLLRRFFLGTTKGGAKALYTLSKKGAGVAEVPQRGPRRASDRALVGDFFVQHQLAVNDIYCALKYGSCPPGVRFKRWCVFQEPVAPGLRLIPDGYVELETSRETVAAFVEVDLGHERLKVWKEKAKGYFELALSGTFEREFHERRFRTLVIAHSPGRMHSIRTAIAPVTDKLFWFSSLPAITRDGIFGTHWLRPREDTPQPFIRETL
jgi:hypothetical protein